MKKILIIVMALFMLGGCVEESNLVATNYNFPVVGEDMNKIIAEEGLPWFLGDEIIKSDTETAYYIKNGNEMNTVKVYCKEEDEARTVILNLLNPENDSDGKIERLDGETIPNMFTMAARIYGLDALSEANKVYKDMIDYMKNRSALEFGESVFESKYGDNYFSFGLDIKDENYNLNYIRIENKVSYESYMKETADKWSENIASQVDVTKDSTIQELRDTSKKEVLIVKGSISKQSRLPVEKAKLLKSIDSKGNEKNISRSDYVDATLVNGDEQISVILRINGLGSEEIKEERTHYIYYSPENTVGIVEYMIK